MIPLNEPVPLFLPKPNVCEVRGTGFVYTCVLSNRKRVVYMKQQWAAKGRGLMAAGLAVAGLVALGFSAVGAERRVSALAPADTVEVPLGLPPIFWPDDNPYSAEKAELGRLLYFDTRLSSDGTVSCASCHESEHGFTDGRAVSTGIGGQQGGRSAPR